MRMGRTSRLDERVASPYLAFMASRLLLTLLALLTGLAAQGSPAQARGCVVDRAEIGALASANTVQERHAITVRAVQHGRVQFHEEAGGCKAIALPHPFWRAPSVLPGIDRARE